MSSCVQILHRSPSKYLFKLSEFVLVITSSSFLLVQVVPLVQILTTGKTEEEYVSILQHLQRAVPNFRPTLVMTDFEVALQNAFQRVFHCHVAGCYWHYCRVGL